MIHVEQVAKAYQGRFGWREVLQDVNLTLARGRNLGILGRNGAGKSTLIRLLAGAERPTRGRIVRDMSVSWPLAFGGAFQPNLTGLDNLKFICRVYGVDWRPLVKRVEDFAELGVYFREPVSHYSMGMSSRLGFALSIAIEFDCFLIDESLVVGDARFHARCHEELFEKRRDRAFIIVSHDEGVIRDLCTRAAVLYQGRLIDFPSIDEAYAFYSRTLQEPRHQEAAA